MLKIINMRYYLILLLGLIMMASPAALAQDFDPSDPEVGIVEHLDDTIPLHLSFLNENNEPVTLQQLFDKPVLLNFVYFDCPGLCNPLLDGVREVVEQTDLALGEDYRVITISFDATDTPNKALVKKENFATKVGDDKGDAWTYLTTDTATILRITDALGFKYKKVGVDFLHPSAIMILSPEGKITRYLYGTYFLPFDLKMSVIEASKGISRPTVNRVLEYCFSYDPAGQSYKLQITKVVATITLIFAGLLLLVLFLKPKRKNKA
jgi:protein SCO1/2